MNHYIALIFWTLLWSTGGFFAAVEYSASNKTKLALVAVY